MTFFHSSSFLLVFLSWFVVEGRFLKKGGSSRGGGTRRYHSTRAGGSSSNNSGNADADRSIRLVIILVLSIVMFAVLPLLVHCVCRNHGQAETLTTDEKSRRDEQDQVQIDVNDEQMMETTSDTDSTGTAPLPNDGDGPPSSQH